MHKLHVCPLNMTRALQYDSCSGQFPNRLYTLANNSYLTFVTKLLDNTYSNVDYFKCDNNKCLEYSKVCDLVDDCGDQSDEYMCTNHFQCSSTGYYIDVTKQCDGSIDCIDLSDECNSDCGQDIIDTNLLKGMSGLSNTD